MEQYIERAVRTLADTEQSSFSKDVAKDILRNAGFSDSEIRVFSGYELPIESPFVMVA